MIAEWTKDIPNWEKEYPTMDGVTLTKREKEILDGDELKSHEGMMFGRMYADWKKGEVLQMKQTENYEQLLQRFTKRTKQLEDRQVELEDAYQEYMKLDRDLDRLKGSIQAIEYCAYGKMPGDGNHDKFKDHKPVKHGNLDALD